MGASSQENQNVKNLVRRTPDIECTRLYPLWESCSIYRGTDNIQCSLGYNVIKTDSLPHLLETKQTNAVDDWKYRREAHENKHCRAEGAECWSPKFWMDAYCARSHSQSRDLVGVSFSIEVDI